MGQEVQDYKSNKASSMRRPESAEILHIRFSKAQLLERMLERMRKTSLYSNNGRTNGTFGHMHDQAVKATGDLERSLFLTNNGQVQPNNGKTQPSNGIIRPNNMLISESPAMEKVRKFIDKVAELEEIVLITGESGTGKDLIARAIHDKSGRTGQFVPVNATELPETLFESELFGYEKGAFTGALSPRAGLIETADKGTLFLDEIGDLPLGSQVKLLRFLQTGHVRRLGQNKPGEFDVRVVLATNQNLKELVREKTFRLDLYHRIKVLDLYIPPLHERPEDILVLARHFLEKFSKKIGVERMLNTAAEQALENYPWPGNVRELENTIRRAVALSETKEISEHDLGLDEVDLGSLHKDDLVAAFPIGKTRYEWERLAIERLLHLYRWNKTLVASKWGISNKTLFDKLARYAEDGNPIQKKQP